MTCSPAESTVLLNEYQRSEHGLGTADVDYLRTEFSSSITLERSWTSGHVWIDPGPHVGVLTLPSGRRLESRPKVPIGSLFYMMAVAYELPDEMRDEISSYESLDEMLEFFATYFVGLVEDRIDDGLYRSYQDREDNLPFLRGKVLFAEDIIRNSVLRHRTYCQFTEYTWDIPENQAIRQVTNHLAGWGFGSSLSKRLRELDSQLSPISTTELSPDDLRGFQYNRFNDTYEPLHRLGALFLEGRSLAESAGEVDAQTFWINMNDLFEDFVTKLLIDRLPRKYSVEDQHQIKLDIDGAVSLIPDVRVQERRFTILMADCKYKRTANSNYKNPDLYQVLAYCVASGCSQGLLMYPKHESDVSDAVTVKHSGIRIDRMSIDLGLPIDDLDSESVRFVTEIAQLIDHSEYTQSAESILTLSAG